MTKTPHITPTFESRLVPQSRECVDLKGNIFFEHNSWLEPGETVVAAGGEAEMTVAKSPYRNPITLKEFVTVARKRKDGSEEWIELPFLYDSVEDLTKASFKPRIAAASRMVLGALVMSQGSAGWRWERRDVCRQAHRVGMT
jgi:hypothetical protein